MDRYQLGDFTLQWNSFSGDLLVMVNGPTIYKPILSRAFPTLYFSRTFEDKYGKYQWGTYIKGAGVEDKKALSDFLKLLEEAVLIDDDLDECFALSFHTKMTPAGGYERTALGKMVRLAKPYDRTWNVGSKSKAKELATRMADFIQEHPTYRRAELLASVPPSNPNKDFDLPAYLVEEIAKITGQAVASSFVKKTRVTRPMKDCQTIQEKIDNIKDAFEVKASQFRGKTVILVDDIYETGFSINEVGRMLSKANAQLVLGLAATKTSLDLSEEE